MQERVTFNRTIYEELEKTVEEVNLYSLLRSDQSSDAEDILQKNLYTTLVHFKAFKERSKEILPEIYPNVRKGINQAIESLEQHLTLPLEIK